MTNWQNLTDYIDTVGTTLKTFIFNKTQNFVRVTTRGNANVTYAIGSQSGTLTPGQSISVSELITSFNLTAASGIQTVEVWAIENGTAILDVAPLDLTGINAKINWADIVKDYGAVSGADSTTAINNAIASGKLLRVPSGTFTFTGTQPTNYVVYFGEGLIVDGTGVPIPRFVKDLGTTYQSTNNLSYIGYVNHTYSGDNATRLYVMPKDKVTTGVGGAIKIFGDAYHLGQDYRDTGLYFHANQNGDIGSNGNGAFWVNSKVFPGGVYDGKWHDIGFSFQDGAAVAGRFAMVNNRPFLIIGAGLSSYAKNFNGIGMEIQTDTVMLKDKIYRFEDETGTISSGFRYNSTSQKLEILVKGTIIASFSPTGATITGVGSGFPTAYVGITSNATTIDASTGGTFVINNSAATSITDLTNGVSGQTVTLVINDVNTTIVNGTAIKLAGGTNFKPATLLSSITLKRLGSSWIETARTNL